MARCLTTAVGGWRCARVSGAATREAETILEKMWRDTTLAHVIQSVFVAVTFHELFKVAALDGNSKLEFGLQWRTILAGLGETAGPKLLEAADAGTLREDFSKLDTDGSGGISLDELQAASNQPSP